MALWSRFFGSAGSQAVGVAMGAAAVPALVPYSQDLINAAWESHASHPLLASVLAAGVSQGQVDRKWATDEAARTGINKERFDKLVDIANVGPGIAEAFDLWRRDKIDEAGFRKALGRLGLEQEWIDALVKVKDTILSPGELASAIHRGLIPDPGLLQGEQPTPPFKVDAYPVYPIDAVQEAAGQGYDKDRLGVLVGLQGLPMGPHEAAQALFRGIITRGDYIRAFNESNNRNEWAEAVLEQSRQIPTARDFFENALRGYHTFEWALAQAKRHGMSEDDATVIYQNQGRPMNVRQITQALSRGAEFHPEPGEIKDPYDAATVEGNIKPAYYEMFKALKYTMPSAFAIRQLTTSGVWSEAKAAKRLKDSGWIPQDADEVAKAWADQASSAGTSGRMSHTEKAQNQLWTRTHTSYLAAEIDETEAREKLPLAGVPASEVDDVLAVWDKEREVERKQLTPAQIKKAWQKAVVNPATGAPWTEDEALAALIGRGYSPNDARTFLDIPSGQ